MAEAAIEALVLPAHAGVSRSSASAVTDVVRAPRTRGGESLHVGRC